MPRASADGMEDVVDGLVDDVRDLSLEVTQLRRTWASRVRFEQARGMLMSRYSIDAEVASELLLRCSSLYDIDQHGLALAIVATVDPRAASKTGGVDVADVVDLAVAHARNNQLVGRQTPTITA